MFLGRGQCQSSSELTASLLQNGQQCCLDGRYYGNVGRFLNHSCQPNLVALQVALGYEIPGIAFFSTRTIPAGEELG